MTRFVGGLVCGLLVVMGLSQPLAAENWPGWRGPRGNGISLERNIPVRWDAKTNVVWKIPTPHAGHASPIIWNGKLFLVGIDREKQNRVLTAINARTGKRLWERIVLHAPLERIHRFNSRASSTPVTDGKLVYVSFLDRKKMFVAAYNLSGRKVWERRPGVFASKHGYCSSPILYKDKVIVNGDHDGNAYLIALDRRTGKTLWKVSRENKTRSYCTPIIRTIGGRTQMMLSGSKCVASYNPDDGSRYWILDGPTEQFVASLVMDRGLVFVTGGFPDKHILTIDPTGSGNITGSRFVKWRHYRKGVSYVPSPIAVGDYFFLVSDNGIGSCYDAQTGKIQWQERMGRRYWSSLVSAGGHVYFLDNDGNTKVVQAGPQYRVLATNRLREAMFASPAISNGRIYIRGEEHLFCIGNRGTKVSRR